MDAPLTSLNLSYKECPAGELIDRMTAGETADLDVQVTDNNGCLADLTKADGESGLPPVFNERGEYTEPLPDPNDLPRHWWGEYIAKAAYWTNQHMVRLPLDVVDAQKGKFRVRVRDRAIRPGLYVAEALFFAPGRALRLREKRWLEVAPNLYRINNGPLTEQEVRMALRDYACFNEFLKREESTPAEIMYALRRPVDIWNELPPPIAPHTTVTFPYRENWLRATIGCLLRSHAASRRRNELTVSNDTIQMRDNDKHQDYDQLGQQYLREFEEWVRQTKVSINLSMGYGTLHSPYNRLPYRNWR